MKKDSGSDSDRTIKENRNDSGITRQENEDKAGVGGDRSRDQVRFDSLGRLLSGDMVLRMGDN